MDSYSNCLFPGGQCPEDFVRYASSCYLFGNLTAHWVDAEKHCQSRHANAHLVAIETESEHNFIVMYRQYNSGWYTKLSKYKCTVFH